MPIIPSARPPLPTPPTPDDVVDPVKYRFKGIVMNNYLDFFGNLHIRYVPLTQPVEYWRRSVNRGIFDLR